MGGKSSKENQKFLDDWVQLQKEGTPGSMSNVWAKRANRRIQMEQYNLHVTSKDQVQAEKKIHQLRHNHPMLVSSLHFKDQTKKQFCSSDYKVTDIPFPDALHVYSQSLQGFHILANQLQTGCFPVSQELIGVNNQGVVKVWMNDKYDRTFPSRPQRIPQQRMVRNILQAIDYNVDNEGLQGVPVVSNYIYGKAKSPSDLRFGEAINLLRNYANQFFGGVIPNKLQCVDKVGGAFLLSKNWQSKFDETRDHQRRFGSTQNLHDSHELRRQDMGNVDSNSNFRNVHFDDHHYHNAHVIPAPVGHHHANTSLNGYNNFGTMFKHQKSQFIPSNTHHQDNIIPLQQHHNHLHNDRLTRTEDPYIATFSRINDQPHKPHSIPSAENIPQRQNNLMSSNYHHIKPQQVRIDSNKNISSLPHHLQNNLNSANINTYNHAFTHANTPNFSAPHTNSHIQHNNYTTLFHNNNNNPLIKIQQSNASFQQHQQSNPSIINTTNRHQHLHQAQDRVIVVNPVDHLRQQSVGRTPQINNSQIQINRTHSLPVKTVQHNIYPTTVTNNATKQYTQPKVGFTTSSVVMAPLAGHINNSDQRPIINTQINSSNVTGGIGGSRVNPNMKRSNVFFNNSNVNFNKSTVGQHNQKHSHNAFVPTASTVSQQRNVIPQTMNNQPIHSHNYNHYNVHNHHNNHHHNNHHQQHHQQHPINNFNQHQHHAAHNHTNNQHISDQSTRVQHVHNTNIPLEVAGHGLQNQQRNATISFSRDSQPEKTQSKLVFYPNTNTQNTHTHGQAAPHRQPSQNIYRNQQSSIRTITGRGYTSQNISNSHVNTGFSPVKEQPQLLDNSSRNFYVQFMNKDGVVDNTNNDSTTNATTKGLTSTTADDGYSSNYYTAYTNKLYQPSSQKDYDISNNFSSSSDYDFKKKPANSYYPQETSKKTYTTDVSTKQGKYGSINMDDGMSSLAFLNELKGMKFTEKAQTLDLGGGDYYNHTYITGTNSKTGTVIRQDQQDYKVSYKVPKDQQHGSYGSKSQEEELVVLGQKIHINTSDKYGNNVTQEYEEQNIESLGGANNIRYESEYVKVEADTPYGRQSYQVQETVQMTTSSNNIYSLNARDTDSSRNYDSSSHYETAFDKYARLGSEKKVQQAASPRAGSTEIGRNIETNISRTHTNEGRSNSPNKNSRVQNNAYTSSYGADQHKSHDEEEYRVEFDPQILADLNKLKGG